MKKAFTLLELIIVVIIIGILAAVALPQYAKVIEKSRTAEAKANLGALRRLEMEYYTQYGVFVGGDGVLADYLGSDLPAYGACNSNHYFSYGCDWSGGTIYCFAARCTSGGKPPDAPGEYVLEIDIDGKISCQPGPPCP